jgi:hypothetical protein
MTTATNASISVRDLIRSEGLAIDSKFLPNPGTCGRIEYLDPATVTIDHSYQRKLNANHATKIGQGFKFLSMKVPNGFRATDGSVLITDGQHTCVGAALAGIPSIPVFVIDLPSTSSAEEALIMQSQQFLSININQKPVSKYDILNNEYIQRDPTAVAIMDACASVGVKPCSSEKHVKTQPGAMSHIHNLKVSWSQIGAKPTVDALSFFRKYWPHAPIPGSEFIGVARFYQVYQHASNSQAGNQLDEATLYRALSQDGGITDPTNIDSLVLEPLYPQTGAVANTKADIWRSRAIMIAYNAQKSAA